MGQFFQLQQVFEVPAMTASFAPAALPLGDRGLYAVAPLGDHPFTAVFEEREFQVNFANSGRMKLFFDDWYFRVHLLPGTLAFGSFSQNTTKGVRVWNAFLTDVNLSAVTLLDSEDSQVFYAGPALPVGFNPLQITQVFFIALIQGPDSISEIATLDFTSTQVDLPITGFRVLPPPSLLWPYPVNWTSPFTVTYDFLTDIITSRRGVEQRRSVRSAPRRRVTFQNVVKPSQLAGFRKLISRRTKDTFLIPDHPHFVKTTLPATDSITAVLDEVPYWIAPDQFVIFKNGDFSEQRLVRSVNGLEVTFWTSGGRTWPAGTRVHPAMVCDMEDSVSANLLTKTVHTLASVFNVLPGSDTPEDYGVAESTFDGRELFDLRHNWSGNQSVTFVRPSEEVDLGYGVRRRFFPNPTPVQRLQYAYSFRSAQAADVLRKFFGRMRGRQGEFYMPTYEPDLIPQLDLLPNVDTQYLRTEGTEDFLTYKDNLSRRAIMVALKDGTRIYRVVESIEVVDDFLSTGTQFNVRGQWPDTILVEDIDYISWVPLWRFSSDTYEERWLSSAACQVAVTVETVERRDADPT